eukprot:Skav215153  [mRNA]  locus=scaffold1997:5224:9161:+ [translate_table: standard]
MLMDGGSAWSFLGTWAALARGETVKAPSASQEHLKLLPDDAEFMELAKTKYGVEPTPGILSRLLKSVIIPVVGAILDTFFLHIGWSLTRHRLFFSDDDLAQLKEEATPKVVTGNMDNWVTLGGMDLPALASHLHESLARKEGTLENQKELWKTITGACQRGVEHDVMSKIHKAKNIDLKFAVNNSSKRALPDFGSGKCESVITNAGPTIFLPGEGGIDVHLDSTPFSSAAGGCSKAQQNEILRAMKALPKKLQ